MPPVTSPQKKRRHDDFKTHTGYLTSLQDDDTFMQSHGVPPRRPHSRPSSLAKKLRIVSEHPGFEGLTARTTATISVRHTIQETSPRPGLPPAHPPQHNHRPASSPDGKTAQMTRSAAGMPCVTAPCHICHRKPTKKTELSSYADCQGCGERTCYVCMRQCLGPGSLQDGCRGVAVQEERLVRDGYLDTDEHGVGRRSQLTFSMCDAQFGRRSPPLGGRHGRGIWVKEGGTRHRRMVCSGCCIEKGVEGEVICLGCLAA